MRKGTKTSGGTIARGCLKRKNSESSVGNDADVINSVLIGTRGNLFSDKRIYEIARTVSCVAHFIHSLPVRFCSRSQRWLNMQGVFVVKRGFQLKKINTPNILSVLYARAIKKSSDQALPGSIITLEVRADELETAVNRKFQSIHP